MGKALGQVSLLIALLLVTMTSYAQQSTRVAFGCCANHAERQPVFDALTLADPDVFVFLGNTLDVSADDMDELLEAYEVFNRFRGPEFCAVNRRSCQYGTSTTMRSMGNAGSITKAVTRYVITF